MSGWFCVENVYGFCMVIEHMNHVVLQGMGDFLNEMATMMNQSKPSVRQPALVSHMFVFRRY